MSPNYRFGKFLLNTTEKTLFADGEPIHLPVKEFQILLMLVENNGRTLGKDEMMSTIWGETFVEESNLAQYISRLRKILSDEGNEYIKTVPKRGYRFSEDVLEDPGDITIERRMRVTVDGDSHRPSRAEGITSVAVLPFIPLALGQDGEFFGVGMADALITELTRNAKIVTRPTSSVLKFVSADRDPIEIAEMLGVDAVIQGSFQKSGNRMRLTAQMLDIQLNKTMWAESFNIEIDDIFEVQERIATRIVTSLSRQPEVTGKVASKRFTENPEAYQEYIQGLLYAAKRTARDLNRAQDHFERAIELDPLYALAHAAMANVYRLLPLSDAIEPRSAYPKAKAAALRALELDDSIAEAHTSLGLILMDYDWNWEGAELSFQKAIEINPNNAAAHQAYGTFLLRSGRTGDAILEFKKAQTIDPLSPAINTWMGDAFAQLGEHDAAIRIHEETLRFAPDFALASYFLVRSYASAGRLDDATRAAENAVKLSGDMSLARTASIFSKALKGERKAALNELREMIEKRSSGYVNPSNIASGFAVLDERDEVFRWLNVALDERDSNLTWLRVDREFDGVRDDPRFHEILRKVGIVGGSNVPSRIDEIDTNRAGKLTSRPLAKSASRRWAIGVIGLAIVLALAAGIAYFWRGGRTSESTIPKKNVMTKLSDSPYEEFSPSFTNDGRIRFFRKIDAKTIVPLSMAADGSDEREETQIPQLSVGLWSPDESKVFFTKKGVDRKFYLANADGSNEKEMAFSATTNADWSPDGKSFLYQGSAKDSAVPNDSDIFIYNVETDTTTHVIHDPAFDADPTFSPDGKSILFVSDRDGNFEIYMMNLATRETRRLTDNPAHEAFPSFSPDGTQILFNSDRESENTDAYVMNLDGVVMRKVTNGSGWDAAPPSGWAPDGTKILLLNDSDGDTDIFVMNFEPYEPEKLFDAGDGQAFPSYSPDGRAIVYQATHGTDAEVRIFETGTGTSRIVTHAVGGEVAAAFSPDGSSILFQQKIADNTEICVVAIDGSGLINLSQNPAKDMHPRFSPDGRSIVFSSSRGGSTTLFQIYLMNADGSDQREIFGDRAMSMTPVFSPDGSTIYFANDREGGRIGNFELFSIPATGGSETRITDRPRTDSSPAVSPDGTRIAFASTTDHNSEIYVINSDGTNCVRLTRDVATDSGPAWSPDGHHIIFSSDRGGKVAVYQIRLD